MMFRSLWVYYDLPKKVHNEILFYYTKLALKFSTQNSPSFSQRNFQSFKMRLKVFRFKGFKNFFLQFLVSLKNIYRFQHTGIQIVQMPHFPNHIGQCFIIFHRFTIYHSCFFLKYYLYNIFDIFIQYNIYSVTNMTVEHILMTLLI